MILHRSSIIVAIQLKNIVKLHFTSSRARVSGDETRADIIPLLACLPDSEEAV
jgi:hypothetical protein